MSLHTHLEKSPAIYDIHAHILSQFPPVVPPLLPNSIWFDLIESNGSRISGKVVIMKGRVTFRFTFLYFFTSPIQIIAKPASKVASLTMVILQIVGPYNSTWTIFPRERTVILILYSREREDFQLQPDNNGSVIRDDKSN